MAQNSGATDFNHNIMESFNGTGHCENLDIATMFEFGETGQPAAEHFHVDGFMASVFNVLGQVDLGQINPTNEYGWCFNHEEKRAIQEVPKAVAQTYFKEDSLVLLNYKQKECLFQLWACQPLPSDATVKIAVFHQTPHERNIPIKMCANDSTKHKTDKYVQTAMTGSLYHQQYGHDVVVVPLNSFVQKNKEKNVETGATGVGYTGKFFLPCKTHDIIKDNKSHVIMVASLEFPDSTPWMRHTEIAMVNVRVCSTPGRELRDLYDALRRDTEPTSSVQANKDAQPGGGWGEGRKGKGKRSAGALCEDDEKLSSSKTPTKTDIRMGHATCCQEIQHEVKTLMDDMKAIMERCQIIMSKCSMMSCQEGELN